MKNKTQKENKERLTKKDVIKLRETMQHNECVIKYPESCVFLWNKQAQFISGPDNLIAN